MSRPEGVVLITGAASGIGEATAQKFAQEGFTVIGADLHAHAGRGRDSGDDTSSYDLRICDVANEAAVMDLVQDVVARHERIDVLVNVAGVVLVRPLAETTWDEFQRLASVNIGGTFLMCKHVLPVMHRQGEGSIVNVGSVSGHVGQVDHALYGATKGAVIALSRALAWEVARHKIRVNSVSPGSVDTPMLRSDIEIEAQRTGEPFDVVKSKREAEQAFRRWADPSEIAATIYFLASPAASFITGTDLLVDCGWVAK